MFGWIAAAHQIGRRDGSLRGRCVLRAALGTYLEAFMLSGLLCLIAALLVLLIGRRAEKAAPLPMPAE